MCTNDTKYDLQSGSRTLNVYKLPEDHEHLSEYYFRSLNGII